MFIGAVPYAADNVAVLQEVSQTEQHGFARHAVHQSSASFQWLTAQHDERFLQDLFVTIK
jgi:hypothetical protein